MMGPTAANNEIRRHNPIYATCTPRNRLIGPQKCRSQAGGSIASNSGGYDWDFAADNQTGIEKKLACEQ